MDAKLADLAEYSDALPDNIDGGSLKTGVQSKVGNVRRNHSFLFFHLGVDRAVVSAVCLENHKLVKTGHKSCLLNDLEK